MPKLICEGLLSDGGYPLPQLLKNANQRLKADGQHGKTCQLKRSGNSITLQFNFNGQQNKGCGCQFTAKGIERAEQCARLVTSQLVANNFTWDWYNRLLNKKEKVVSSPKNFKASLEEYKKNWLSENRHLKNPHGQWHVNFSYIESYAQTNCQAEQLSESIVKSIVAKTSPNSHIRLKTLNALLNYCRFFEIADFNSLIDNLKKKNKIPKTNKYIPDDREIEYIYQNGFSSQKNIRKDYLYRFPQWQFLYGLLATYGLRVHEAWSIANWDNSVRIKKGDWVTVEAFEDNEETDLQLGQDFIVPAILNSDNKNKILCIKHATKTGYRMAMPLSPLGKDWLTDFNIIQPLNLPDMPNPLELKGKYKLSYACTASTGQWFRRYDFTAHALRHAYNHRGHSLGINPTLLAQSLGHSLQINSSTYLKTMPESRKLENFQNAISEQLNKQSELERLQAENIALKAENELLRTKLSLLDREQKGNL